MFFMNQDEFNLNNKDNSQLDRINDSILSKGKKDDIHIDDSLSKHILSQLRSENDDIFRQVNVQRNQFQKKVNPVIKPNSRGVNDKRPPLLVKKGSVQDIQSPMNKNKSITRNSPVNRRKDTEPSNDMVSVLASRLTKVELENQNLKQDLESKNKLVHKLEAQLQMFRKKSNKDIEDMLDRKVNENKQLKLQIQQMEDFLKEHGLIWKGYGQNEGEFKSDELKQKLTDKPLYNYGLPSQIDINLITIRINELNHLTKQEGVQQVYKDSSGAHKLKEVDTIPIGFYKDGVVIKGFPLFGYESNEGQQILADILEGYFPIQLKNKYPNGVILQMVTKIDQKYNESVQKSKQTRLKSIGDIYEDQLKPKDKDEFLKQLPKNVVKDGKVYSIRNEIEKHFDTPSLIPDEIIVPTAYKLQMDRNELTDEQKTRMCIIKVKMEANVNSNKTRTLIIHLDKDDSIQTVYQLIDKYSDFQENTDLVMKYPRKTISRDSRLSLEQLGLHPNAALVLPK